jgi:hypothetical protein
MIVYQNKEKEKPVFKEEEKKRSNRFTLTIKLIRGKQQFDIIPPPFFISLFSLFYYFNNEQISIDSRHGNGH